MEHTPGFLAIVNDAKTRVKEISVAEVQKRLHRGDDFAFIDTREEHEWKEAHAVGATYLGKGIIEREIERAIPDKSKDIVLYCGGGFRSALAADNLQKMGYRNVYSMAGGWKSWKNSGGKISSFRYELDEDAQRFMVMENLIPIRSGNPFTPMTGIEPSVFGGRRDELQFFEQRLERALQTNYCEHFLVLGNWGIGKSTLFKEYKRICQNKGYLASLVPLENLQHGTKQIDAARSIVEGMLRDLPFPVDKFKKVSGFFDSVGINVLGTGLNFSRDTTKKDLSTQSFFHDTFVNLWQDVKSKTKVFVLLLDDLDNFSAVSEIVMTLKQTLSMDALRKTKIIVGLSSTQANWLALTSIKKHHPLSRYFLSRIELTSLNERELADTVARSLSGTGVEFSRDVIKKIFTQTGGHPFEMQVLCFHLFNYHLARKVTLDVWEKALTGAVNDLGVAVFDNWFFQASGEEAKVLRLVADGREDKSIKQIETLAKTEGTRISTASIAKYLQRLTEKNLVTKSSRGFYSIPDPMFRVYLQTRSE